MGAGPIDPTLLDRFEAIVGPAHAVRLEAEIAPYVHELRGLYPGRSPLVLKPGSVEEVSRILALATETGTAVVPQGGNTGLVGGQVPHGAGNEIVVSLSRLNRVRAIDPLSNTVTVEAGVVLETLHQVADAVDRLFPLSLASQGSCQIGGNLSSNAGGTAVLAYGNTRELCLGVEVVLPTGEVLDDLRKLKKDNTGYDLKNLFVGAEGTLGIITAAVMKLFPRPKGRQVGWVGVKSPEDALALFGLASERAGNNLTAFELIGKLPLDFVMQYTPGAVAPLQPEWPWNVLVEISSGRSSEDATNLMGEILTSGLEQGIAGDAVIAASLAQADAFWALRENLSDAQRPEGGSIKHDISVPVASIPTFIARAAEAVTSVSPQARVVCFGHMGDGNLHYNVSQPAGGDKEAFLGLYRAMNKAVHDIVHELGGSISAEHGIGQLKRDELLATAPSVATDLMRRIKANFDPAGIMNPGKLL